jgi:hypothetical protein
VSGQQALAKVAFCRESGQQTLAKVASLPSVSEYTRHRLHHRHLAPSRRLLLPSAQQKLFGKEVDVDIQFTETFSPRVVTLDKEFPECFLARLCRVSEALVKAVCSGSIVFFILLVYYLEYCIFQITP